MEEQIISDIIKYYMNTLSTQKTVKKFSSVLQVYKFGFAENGMVNNVKVYHDLSKILTIVCHAFGINEFRIKSHSMISNEVCARIAYAQLSFKYNGSDFKEITKELNKDRSTMYYWLNEHKKRINIDNLKSKDYERNLDYLTKFKLAESIVINEFISETKILEKINPQNNGRTN